MGYYQAGSFFGSIGRIFKGVKNVVKPLVGAAVHIASAVYPQVGTISAGLARLDPTNVAHGVIPPNQSPRMSQLLPYSPLPPEGSSGHMLRRRGARVRRPRRIGYRPRRRRRSY
jgi:hypothetical protein